jgi:hypothetical protein
MATLEELQALLTEAQSAHHKILLGGQAQTVREADGSTVIYNNASATDLSLYISRLQGEISALQGGSSLVGGRRAIQVVF